MRIVVTGAGGFLGAQLVERILAEDGLGCGHGHLDYLTAVDLYLPRTKSHPKLRIVTGSLEDRSIRDRAIDDGVDCLFHLAAIPGGMAEADNLLGWRLNHHATMALLDDLSVLGNVPIVVYTSTIAVFGAPLPARVDDDTSPVPSLSYGAQKLMVEIALADMSRRSVIDARCIRLPGIVARPMAPAGHASAFMSNMFHSLSAGQPIVLPVPADGTVWAMSAKRALDNLLHASRLDEAALPRRRAWTLPALHLSISQLVEAIGMVGCTDPAALVSYQPVEAVVANFASNPPLSTEIADALGFKHDGDAESLVRRVFAQLWGAK